MRAIFVVRTSTGHISLLEMAVKSSVLQGYICPFDLASVTQRVHKEKMRKKEKLACGGGKPGHILRSPAILLGFRCADFALNSKISAPVA